VINGRNHDACGRPTIWDKGLVAQRQSSICTNPHLFTGRRVDILDNGSLTIQYNRNPYCDYYTGRWTTHNPLEPGESPILYKLSVLCGGI
jgi:hypothetical protein